MNDKKQRSNLAKIGILAAIDEATGYQEVRPKNALRKRFNELEGRPEDADLQITVAEGQKTIRRCLQEIEEAEG